MVSTHKVCFVQKIRKLMWIPLFGSTVYIQTIVYKEQNFLKVVVHMIINDQ